MSQHLVLRVVTKLMVGFVILFALYVQFHGDYSPGGGFQAGVIFAAAFILYGLVLGLENVQAVLPPWFTHKMMALGVLIYTLVGIYSFFVGFNFLDYGALTPSHPEHGQHYGILLVELGVGITVAGVVISIYYAFVSRSSTSKDEEW